MASAYSSLKIELIGTGEQSGTWGTTTNTNLGTALEEAITGRATANFTTDADLTLGYSDSNATQTFRNLILNVTSVSLSTTRNLIVPTIEKQYLVENNTTGGQSIVIKTAAGTGITIPNGKKAHVYADGTNVVQASDFFPTIDINGGTIDGATIGASSAGAATFTNLTASGTVNFSGATVSNGGTVTTVDINGGTIDGTTIGGSTPAAGTFTTATATTGNITTVNATTVNTTTLDLTNLEVTNIKAKDGTAAATIADSTGKITVSTELAVDNLNLSGNALTSTNANGNIDLTPNGTGEVNITKVDIDSGAIDGTTIGANSAAAGTFTNLTATTGVNFSGATVSNGGSVTTVDINGGTIDGTTIGGATPAAGAFTTLSASSTATLNTLVSSGATITGGTINNTAIGGSTPAAGTFTTATATTGNITTVNATTVDATNVEVTNIKAKDGTAAVTIADSTGVVTLASSVLTTTDINGGTIDNTTIGGSTPAVGLFTQVNVDNLRLDGNALTSTNSNGNIDLTPNGTGEVNITKVDIDAGTIDGTTIGGSSAAAITGTTITANTSVSTDVISEKTSAAGVTIDSVLLKDNTITANAIYAQTISSISSFSWDSNTSTPAASSTNPYGGGAPVVTNIHRRMRRCLLADDGTVNYYLDPSDSAYKEDGTASVLTGADGMVMVEIPAFYVNRSVAGTVTTWSIADVPLSGFELHPAFIKDKKVVLFRYISAYDACYLDATDSTYKSGLNLDDLTSSLDLAADKLSSVSGVYPIVGVTRAECRTLASNRGSGWRQLDFALFSAVQLLYLIENQSFYSQNILGAGNTAVTNAYGAPSSSSQTDSPHSVAGKSNSLGNASTNTSTGASSASRDTAFMSYRGVENFYGNCWNWADGILVNDISNGNVHVSNDSAEFSDSDSTGMQLITSSAPTTSNYVSAIAAIDNYFIATSVSGGSSSTYLTDYWYGSTSADRVVLVGGDASSGALAGAFLVNAVAASYSDRTLGARLAF